jgi:hypothetical protein
LRKSTLVSIAVTFLVASAAVVWVCYISFKSSVMSFEDTNAPGGAQAQVTPLPVRVPVRPPPAAVAPTPEPTEEPALNPALIPTMAPIVIPRTSPGRPNGRPPPDA